MSEVPAAVLLGIATLVCLIGTIFSDEPEERGGCFVLALITGAALYALLAW